jgi:hypothetical protein
MWPKNLVLYVFMFCLGLAYNVNIKDYLHTHKAEYVISIDKDIGVVAQAISCEETKKSLAPIVVHLKTIVIIGESSVKKELSSDIQEQRTESVSLEEIPIPIAYLIVSNPPSKPIGEQLKIC